jgi:hypothetical protein
MRILDPTDERVPVRRSLAARPEGVTGTVGLLDINKARGDVMLKHVEHRLNELLPNVVVKHYRKLTPARPAAEALRQQMMQECDFVIEGLAD